MFKLVQQMENLCITSLLTFVSLDIKICLTINVSFYAKTVSSVNLFFIITRMTANKEPHLRVS